MQRRLSLRGVFLCRFAPDETKALHIFFCVDDRSVGGALSGPYHHA